MESATHPDATTTGTENGASNGQPTAKETFEVHRPIDGSVLQEVAIDSPADVAAAVAGVRANQPAWEAIGFAGRQRWLESLRDWILANQDAVDDLMQQETGKVRADAALEAFYVLDAINFWCDQGPKFLADEVVSPHNPLLKAKRAKIVYRPFGVVGMISPWNFPVILSLGDAIPALLAGNAVVIKPSELTPLTLIELVRAWREEVGAPDVLAVVNGMAETGGALVDESDYMQFTGSEKTGKIVMKRAAETLTPVSLELGGKDPMIVTRDADLERAVNATAWGGLLNTRSDLHLDRARLRRGADLRRVRRQAHGEGPDPAPGRRRRHLHRRGRRDDLAGAGRDRLRPGRGRARGRRPDPDRRQAQGRPRRLVRADRDRRRRPLDEGDARGDLRPGDPGDEGARRRAGDRARQRLHLRARLVGVRRRPRRGRADRPPDRGRALQRQRRADQLQRPRAADGRLEELRDRRPPRRPGDPPLLPHRGGDDPAAADGEVGAGLVPLQRPQARLRPPHLPLPQRPRAAQPARAEPTP